MSDALANLSFKYTWRDYQGKFLDNFQHHITDNHLHVVAPPGSGKTILGLEMAIRLCENTLVLSPTLTIRNQWLSRLQTFFSPSSEFGDYSKDINALKAFNFCTYQSLHALHKKINVQEGASLIKHFKKANIKTIVLDEAHHLKNEWWKALWEIKKIEDITIVALTATPPYDSSYLELQKYFKLCGPIDDEIAVPDLIKNGDLCPHQDFIHFSLPEETTLRKIVSYRTKINDFYTNLKQDREFVKFLMQLDFYIDAENHLDRIYEIPSFFSSILIFLNACGIPVKKEHLELLGITDKEVTIPNLDYQWCQILLENILVDLREQFIEQESLLKRLEDELKTIGVIYRGRLNFVGENVLYKDLATSVSKFKSVQEILENANDNLGQRLRAVVLVDYICKEFLNTPPDEISKLNKMGAVPLFQYLNHKTQLGDEIAVLTGSIVLVPKRILEELKRIVPETELSIGQLKNCKSHISIKIKGENQRVVAVLGQLFANGAINILIGTKSLLGEGWDAPSINTLILASYVGSFVSSNQMRGRAIRVDPDFKEKVGRIWHLACLDPTTENGGDDVAMLAKRFKAFSGVSLDGNLFIENGLSRMRIDEVLQNQNRLAQINQKMFLKANNSDKITSRWNDAIAKGSILVNALRVPFQKGENYGQQKRFYALNVFKYLFYEITIAGLYFIPELLLKNFKLILNKGFLALFYILFFFLGIRLLPKLFKATKLYFMYGDQYKRAKKIAQMLVKLCLATGRIHMTDQEIRVISEQNNNGRYAINFIGLSLQESSMLIGFMEELILPIDNPRYLIVQSSYKRLLGYRQFYAVPDEFGRRKEDAQLFIKYWNSHVGGGKLKYSRTKEGRKMLVTARLSHILYQFIDPPEKVTSWR